MNYQSYQLEDFVIDTFFQAYVLKKDPEAIQFWEHWMTEHPDQAELIEEASAYILAFESSRIQLPPERINQNWTVLQNKLQDAPAPPRTTKKHWLGRYRYAVAAAVALMLLFVGYQLTSLYQTRDLHQLTAYGETKEIWLPDSSRVVLNANSKLVYQANWSDEETRSVQLSGEAYFDVRKRTTPSGKGQAFHVMADGLKVEVLGTTFNVNSRRGQGKVVLNTGKIQLSHQAYTDTIVMEPGEMVEIDQQMEKSLVNPRRYISWTENILVLDETSVAEIAQTIGDTYGMGVEIIGQELADKTLTGEVVVIELQDLLDVLETSFKLEITQTENSLIFRQRP